MDIVEWKAGQTAVIDGTAIVTIDRVTPSGRAIVGDRIFNADGFQRGTSAWHAHRLEPLTAEIAAEIALKKRARLARNELDSLVDQAIRWMREALPMGRYHRGATAYDVDKAERLIKALRVGLEFPTP